MGDVIHALPALNDLYHYHPEAKVDWVIDKSFQDVASWHPIVDEVIVSNHRHWKKNIITTLRHGEATHFLKRLREKHYDYIIDGQSALKSAIISCLARGERYGMDKNSVRDKYVHLAYQHHYFVDKKLHAITRLRLLLSQIFHYPLPNEIHYGIDSSQFSAVNFKLPNRYLVFVHNGSWPTKLWPVESWRKLIDYAQKANYSVLLPWGSEEEQKNAQAIANNYNNALVLPRLPLSTLATVFQHAKGAICCDTGLSHLASALSIPNVTLYGPTDAQLIGISGTQQLALSPDFACQKCYQRQCHYQNQSWSQAQCLAHISPEVVWDAFLNCSTKK
jgi:heptosyltransferase-1